MKPREKDLFSKYFFIRKVTIDIMFVCFFPSAGEWLKSTISVNLRNINSVFALLTVAFVYQSLVHQKTLAEQASYPIPVNLL